jgi:hypothetical protein
VLLYEPFVGDHPLIRHQGGNATLPAAPICHRMEIFGVGVSLQDPAHPTPLSSVLLFRTENLQLLIL